MNTVRDVTIKPADHGATLLDVHGVAVLLSPRDCEVLAVQLLERAKGVNAHKGSRRP